MSAETICPIRELCWQATRAAGWTRKLQAWAASVTRAGFLRTRQQSEEFIVKRTERQTGTVAYASTAKGPFTLNENTMTRRTLLLLGMLVIVAVPICLYAYCVRYLWEENAKPPLDGYASYLVASALFAAVSVRGQNPRGFAG